MQRIQNLRGDGRRGRWVNAKVMDIYIYIQEIRSVQFLSQMSELQRGRVIAKLFPLMLERATALKRARIPSNAWYPLLVSEELEL